MTDVGTFIWRGALAGGLAGVSVALFQWLVTERQIDIALDIEAATAAAGGDEMFTRPTQVFGGVLAAVLFGVLLGVVFAVVLARLWHRLPGGTDFSRAIRLAAAAFVTVTLVPALKYPGNPPAVGDPDTVNQRTAAYAGLLVASVLVAFVAWRVWEWATARRIDGARRFGLTALAYGAPVTAAYVLFPANPDQISVPANLIWHFRIDSLGQGALMWTMIAVGFGLVCEWVTSRAGTASKAAGDRVSAARS